MALTGLSGLPARENFKTAPSEHLFREREARLAPAGINRGLAWPGGDLAIGQRAPDRRGDMVGDKFRDPDLPGRPDDGREGVHKLNRGIRQQAAPIAGMVPALAGVDPEVDRVGAAGTKVDCRPDEDRPRSIPAVWPHWSAEGTRLRWA
jgi:hypothetical protein